MTNQLTIVAKVLAKDEKKRISEKRITKTN